MKKWIGISVMMLIFGAFFGGTAFSQGAAGTTLTAVVSCTPHYTLEYGWTIDKSVSPASWTLFSGDNGTSRYTITITKDNGTYKAWIDGVVSITNGGAVATEGLNVVIELRDGVPPPNDLIATTTVDVSGMPSIPAFTGPVDYAYHIDIPAAYIHPGGNYKITANITITNHSGHLGTPFGPAPSCTCILPATPTVVNDMIHVDDTNGGSWEFNAGGTVSYTKTFSCNGDAGSHNNTATIRETGQSDDASVAVNCYALQINKDAATEFTRTYNWTIDKSADQSSLTLSTGQIYSVNYSVVLGATYTDGGWNVKGNITVYNPAPIAAVINGVSDLVSPAITATVNCGVTFPYALAAGGTLNCTYSANLPDVAARTNTATATLQNYAYDELLNATPNGTTDFSGTAAVSFSNATMLEADECLDVSDTYAGALGTVCYTDLPVTFNYNRNIGPYDVCGDYSVSNTASFVTNDLGVTGSDGWNVAVHVPCLEGCTLTPGYWKTHSEFGPAPYDNTWSQLSNGASTPFFLSGHTYYQVLWTPSSGGNAYYILAHQYIAAQLNFLNGADPTAAQAAFNSATALFNTYAPAQIGALKGNNPVRKQFLALATTLDDYNNGLIGPGHCSEESAASAPKIEETGEVAENSTPVAAPAIPTTYSLGQNYPNPFNPATTFTFDLPEDSYVKLTIYNLAGQELATVVKGLMNVGSHRIHWLAPANLATGVYLYRLQAGEFASTRKMLFVK